MDAPALGQRLLHLYVVFVLFCFVDLYCIVFGFFLSFFQLFNCRDQLSEEEEEESEMTITPSFSN